MHRARWTCDDVEFPGKGGSPCISRRLHAAPTLHRALFNGRFFALFGRLINHGGSRLYFAPVFRCNREPGLPVVPERGGGGDTVASLHNEQDAATPLELVLRAPRQPPCFPVAASRLRGRCLLLLRPYSRPPLLPPSCNHVHPPHQPIISPYYVTSRCVTCLATPRRCSKCLVGNSKNDGGGGKSAIACSSDLRRKDQDIVRGRGRVRGWEVEGWTRGDASNFGMSSFDWGRKRGEGEGGKDARV